MCFLRSYGYVPQPYAKKSYVFVGCWAAAANSSFSKPKSVARLRNAPKTHTSPPSPTPDVPGGLKD
ncbi:MAG: hypothetical protein FWB80_09390 [Defluviitaleaceae bacterium]|nr:hypothetical protein [Defluviitaleaceae bacterium]